jgi:hypothetical protein
MSQTTKSILYLALLVCLVFFGYRFYSEFQQMPTRQAEEPAEKHSAVTPDPTNSLAVSNAPTSSNLTTTSAVATVKVTSAPAGDSNVVVSSPPPDTKPRRYNAARMLSFVGLFVVSAVLFGLMVARDISHFVAHRTHEYVLTDENVASKPADYERAEELWANGEFLDAIQMMRDLLKKRPHDLFIAQRIAEIYENDLQNYLAAVLEYEEILKHKFDPERWGWMAIHLANLYSGKLNQAEKAVELLKRIDVEHGHTAAAKKARERVGKGEPGTEEPTEAEGAIKLPPGFRPKES